MLRYVLLRPLRPELDAKTKTCLPAKTHFCHLDEQANIDNITVVEDTTMAENDQTDPCSRCKFPFIYKDHKLTTCFKDEFNNDTWCSTKKDENGIHVDGYEQSCQGFTCGDSKYHINWLTVLKSGAGRCRVVLHWAMLGGAALGGAAWCCTGRCCMVLGGAGRC
jgi:hypothetical protein